MPPAPRLSGVVFTTKTSFLLENSVGQTPTHPPFVYACPAGRAAAFNIFNITRTPFGSNLFASLLMSLSHLKVDLGFLSNSFFSMYRATVRWPQGINKSRRCRALVDLRVI